LFNIAKGHALLYGRNFVTIEDIPIVVKTVLSTAEIDRVKVFSLLLGNKGKSLSTSMISQSLNISPQTARRKMTEFKAIRLIDEPEYSGSSHELSIKLREEFNWFLGEEFNKVRDGFEPADYHEYLKEDKEKDNKDNIASEVADQQSPTSYLSAYENMIVFDRVFKELAKECEPFAMEADKGSVGRDDLQKRLVATGKFKLIAALNLIDEMIRINKIKIVMLNTYRMNDVDSNSSKEGSSG
jgi:hypothetical protein